MVLSTPEVVKPDDLAQPFFLSSITFCFDTRSFHDIMRFSTSIVLAAVAATALPALALPYDSDIVS